MAPDKWAQLDFKGLGFSKVGHFKEVRSKIRELEVLNLELARHSSKLEAILNSMNDGLTILNQDLTIVFANRVQEQLFPDSRLPGGKCYQIYFHQDKPCRNCPALETIRTAKPLRGEFQIRRGFLASHFFEWTTSPLRNRWGQVEEVLLCMRDITVRKECEFNLMQADRMAAIGLLADSIAHEINNPLTSIAGFAEALLNRLMKNFELTDPNLQKTFKDYLEIINSEAHRCKDIIRQLHDFSRQSPQDFAVLKIDQIIQDTIALLRQYAKHRKVKLMWKSSLAHGLNLVGGNEGQLKHAFLNLLQFLLSALPAGSNLTIVARNLSSMIEVQLTARPEGSAALPERPVYQAELRADPPCSEIPTNLSICHSIVRQHQGELHLDQIRKDEPSVIVRFPLYTS